MVMRWVVVPVDAGSVSVPLRSAQNRGPPDLVRPVGHIFGGYSSGTEAGLSSPSDGVSTHTVGLAKKARKNDETNM